MSAFTHYWERETLRRHDDSDRAPLRHIAGNQFRRRGVQPGDAVYIVNVAGGRLRLISRILIDEVIGEAEARERFGDDLFPASEHCLRRNGKGEPVDLDRFVEEGIVRKLTFINARGRTVHPKFTPRGSGLLDSQTLRGVRRLTEESARLLDAQL